jgi:hypothetical protein
VELYVHYPLTYSWRGAKLIKHRDNFIAKETHYVSMTKPNRLMLFREMIAVYCENNMKYINTLMSRIQYIYTQSVPHRIHITSLVQSPTG